MDMEKLASIVRARREAAGLLADNGVHCATKDDLAFQNAKHDAKVSGARDAETTARLTMLKAAAVASHGR